MACCAKPYPFHQPKLQMALKAIQKPFQIYYCGKVTVTMIRTISTKFTTATLFVPFQMAFWPVLTGKNLTPSHDFTIKKRVKSNMEWNIFSG